MEVPNDIMFRYLERRKNDLNDCVLYLEKKNFIKLEKLGHQLKGNGVTFGHPELSSIGILLESAARQSDLKSSYQAVESFSRWVKDHQPN